MRKLQRWSSSHKDSSLILLPRVRKRASFYQGPDPWVSTMTMSYSMAEMISLDPGRSTSHVITIPWSTNIAFYHVRRRRFPSFHEGSTPSRVPLVIRLLNLSVKSARGIFLCFVENRLSIDTRMLKVESVPSLPNLQQDPWESSSSVNMSSMFPTLCNQVVKVKEHQVMGESSRRKRKPRSLPSFSSRFLMEERTVDGLLLQATSHTSCI